MRWKKEFESRHAPLDLEHRKIFDLINKCEQQIQQRATLESLESVLRDIRRCVDNHFAWEEGLMAEIGFPDIEAHRVLHKMLLASLKDRMQEMPFCSLTPDALLELMTNWFATHTSQDDKELASCLRSSQAG